MTMTSPEQSFAEESSKLSLHFDLPDLTPNHQQSTTFNCTFNMKTSVILRYCHLYGQANLFDSLFNLVQCLLHVLLDLRAFLNISLLTFNFDRFAGQETFFRKQLNSPHNPHSLLAIISFTPFSHLYTAHRN